MLVLKVHDSLDGIYISQSFNKKILEGTDLIVWGMFLFSVPSSAVHELETLVQSSNQAAGRPTFAVMQL